MHVPPGLRRVRRAGSLALLGLTLAAPRAEATVSLDSFDVFSCSSACTTSTSPCTTDQMGIPTTDVLSGRRQTQPTDTATPVQAPEPSTAGLLLVGLLGLARAGRGRRATA